MELEDQIREIEEEIANTKYNKATQHHIGKLKAKLAQLKEKVETRKKSKGKGLGFGVRKTGHATVVFVGLPSVGKSTLLNRLTNAQSRVGAYEFTTLEVIPGMMSYEGVNIQLLDLPGLITGAAGGKGRGREVLSMVRNADLCLIVLDVNRIASGEEIKNELEDIGVRLDKEEPDITLKRRDRGGIKITKTRKVRRLDEQTIKSILGVHGIHNADVLIREDINEDQLNDAILGNRVYVPSIVVVNKIDTKPGARLPRGYLPISAEDGSNLEELKDLMFKKLDFIRVYMKPQGGKADYKEPMILKKGATVKDLCEKMHKDFVEKFRYAIVSGDSVKHDEQRCGITHVLKDRDTVTIIKELQ
ncbi:MAG: GTP-binding protein [Candidatus Altiarchaeales archaeon]|nr:GTP-binding protein [Candidatus Altiarchaeales archaeon]MBD3416706.1 GTP-binding protein [Candidatus Altiarchaeales archaeon]